MTGSCRASSWIALIVFLVLYPIRKLVWWLTSDFVVTSSRVIHREGFIAKRSMEIPLDKINDVRFEQGIFERMVGAGTQVIQSASESGRNEFKFIRHPEEVQRTIYHGERSRSDAYRSTGHRRRRPPPRRALDHHRTRAPRRPPARGVLTEEEFQAQKARILGQG
jgi:uncharacterized membrane protein YdbT with pleckstrin-like domain